MAAARIGNTAAVTGAEIKEPIGPEPEGPAVVVGLWLRELEDAALGAGVGLVGRPTRHTEFAEPVDVVGACPGRRRRVVDEEPAIRGKPGMKGQPEQAPFVVVGGQPDDLLPDVEKRPGEKLAAGDDPDQPGLVYEKEATRAVGRHDDPDRSNEPRRHEAERDLRSARRWPLRRRKCYHAARADRRSRAGAWRVRRGPSGRRRNRRRGERGATAGHEPDECHGPEAPTLRGTDSRDNGPPL